MLDRPVAKIPIELIRTGNNPRKTLDNIEELAASIKAKGLISPLLVRGPNRPLTEVGEHYTLIAGGRRLAALKQLKVTEVECRVVAPNETLLQSEVLVLALAENLQRDDMNALDTANAIVELRGHMDTEADGEGSTSVAQLAAQLSKSAAFVTQHLELLKMPAEVLEAVKLSQISFSTAMQLNRLADPTDQVTHLKKLLNSEISVKGLKAEISRLEAVESHDVDSDDEAETTEESGGDDAAATAAAAVNNPRDPAVRTLDTVPAATGTNNADAPSTAAPAGADTSGTPHIKAPARPVKPPKPAKKVSSTLIEGIKVAKFSMLTEKQLREKMLEVATKAEQATDEAKKTELGFVLAGLSMAAGLSAT